MNRRLFRATFMKNIYLMQFNKILFVENIAVVVLFFDVLFYSDVTSFSFVMFTAL